MNTDSQKNELSLVGSSDNISPGSVVLMLCKLLFYFILSYPPTSSTLQLCVFNFFHGLIGVCYPLNGIEMQ